MALSWKPTLSASFGTAAMTDNKNTHRLIVSGFGGQGILTLGKLICHAAISQGQQVTYLPSYGAEVRGGTANCQLVIADHEIFDPLVKHADTLIILNKLSLDRFRTNLTPGGILVLNTSMIAPDDSNLPADARFVPVPATDRAAALGDIRSANILALGAYTRASGIVSEQTMRQTVAAMFEPRGPKLLKLNLKAFDEGYATAETPQ